MSEIEKIKNQFISELDQSNNLEEINQIKSKRLFDYIKNLDRSCQ